MMDGLFPIASWLIFWDREVGETADYKLLSPFDGGEGWEERSIFGVLTHGSAKPDFYPPSPLITKSFI